MSAAAKVAKEHMVAFVRARVTELRNLPYSQLEALPEASSQEVDIPKTPYRLTVYRKSRSPQELLVAVQAYRERYFGMISQIHTEGFLMSANGNTTTAPEELLWDYT